MTLLVLALMSALMAPAVRRAALQRRRTFFWAGITIFALGVATLAITLAYPSAISPDLGAEAFAALFLVGAMVVWLPQTSKTVERAVQAQKSLGPKDSARQGLVNPAAEAREALKAPLGQRGPFIRVVGPWLVAFCVLPLVLLALGETAKPETMDRAQAINVLLILLGVILAEFLILIMAAIQWTRFVATGQEPRLTEIPGRALWGWVWRLFVFGSIFRASDGLEPWLGHHLPRVDPWALHGLSSAVLLCLAVLATPFAINLTCVALGDSSQALEVRLKVLRMAGRRIYIGAALVLAPFFFFTWASETFGDYAKGAIAQQALGYLEVVVLFLTVTAFFGYLARLHIRAAEATPLAG